MVEDRLFLLQEGVVIVNPKERIEYSEKVATRDMKPLEPYIKADVIGYPDYSAEATVTPSPREQSLRKESGATEPDRAERFPGSDELNDVLDNREGRLPTVMLPRRRGI